MAYRAMSISDSKIGPDRVDAEKLLPALLRALGLGPGDRLVVRSPDGTERELPLDCLDREAVREVMDS